MADELGFDFKSLSETVAALQKFIEPALNAELQPVWNPEK
jgi:hypothetical protein